MSSSPQSLSHEERVHLSRTTLSTLDDWGVKGPEQITLLAMPEGTKARTMQRYRNDTPLPDDVEIWQRVQQIAGIAEALYTTYPRNPNMGLIWMHRVNYRFDDRTPLASMLEDGLNGMIAVHMHLDCSYDWHMDEQQQRG